MAWYPDATRLNIPPGTNDPRIKPRISILHVDAGNAESLYHYFNGPSNGVESHFYVTKRPDPDRPGFSVVEQYRDTDFQADTSLNANDFSTGIETQGYGEGEWTAEQMASIKALLRWLHDTHGTPYKKCEKWDGSGVGYHVMFGAPGPWAPVAKSCPGPDRVKQFNNDIVPWLNAGAPAPEGDDDMQLNDKIEDDLTFRQLLRKLNRFIDNEAKRNARVLEAIKALPATPSGEVNLADVEQAVRNVFADASEG